MPNPTHPWLKSSIHLAYLPGTTTPLSERVAANLLQAFRSAGHITQAQPDDDTDMILATARYGEQVPWREAQLFSARRRYRLSRAPTVFTLVHITGAEFKDVLHHLAAALARRPLDAADFSFPGLSASAPHVLAEQGRRAGPILALQRVVQAQSKSIRVLLLVGDERPEHVFHFDLAGAYPCSSAADPDFYQDIVLRIVTVLSTCDIAQHQPENALISQAEWQGLSTPNAMLQAGTRLGERGFFTEMVRITDLVSVPAVGDVVAAQYSEGCFATWEPRLNALLATVTGRARPITKHSLTEDDLAVISGIRPDGLGALVRYVEGGRNLPASSEAVEMLAIDSALPQIHLPAAWQLETPAPMVRSKLHGHRSIDSYDPRLVEYVPMAAPYQHYLVSCGSDAQARGIRDAFSASAALHDQADARQAAFTVLPGHGVVIAEKWAEGKAPFQLIWEYMDTGVLQVGSRLPQGRINFFEQDGRMRLDPGCLMNLDDYGG